MLCSSTLDSWSLVHTWISTCRQQKKPPNCTRTRPHEALATIYIRTKQMIEIIRCHTQLNYAKEYLKKPRSLSISIIFPVTPPSFPHLALRVSCISLPICVQLRAAQSNWVFSRSHNRFEWFCAYRVNSSVLRLGHVISQASKSIIFFLFDWSGQASNVIPPSFPKAHGYILSFTSYTLTSFSFGLSIPLFPLFRHFCHSPNFSCFPPLRVLWSNCTGSLLMNQMSCRHRKTSGPNCWYAIISVFGAREWEHLGNTHRKHTSTHTF